MNSFGAEMARSLFPKGEKHAFSLNINKFSIMSTMEGKQASGSVRSGETRGEKRRRNVAGNRSGARSPRGRPGTEKAR
ncbi:hypothetical protein A5N82_03955 [Christensenella minuta]|uniref:Uncharacterized protein n=1 Tax=Christensenella minuta TaxID=626937 RepID=A0A136Q3W6_9FIRM|nr:hypothetical protein B1H56_10795 [Christensenella minuta]KXK65373.1 hypothetical protein HMPREF3293_01585 [Christensenella minuta]OAQ42531.1 hypothetical protein A5N82_03955 [Christensenella minuta]